MKYCGYCGGENRQLNATSFKCSRCGRSSYTNPKAAVALVLIDSENRYVFGVRARDPEIGKLDCIGGFLDVGENFETALFREVKEEADINPEDIEGLDYLSSSYDAYTWEGGEVPTASVYFIARLRDGAVLQAADDISDIVYLGPSQLNPDDFAWDGMRTAFEKLAS